jgi:hypothetical protein
MYMISLTKVPKIVEHAGDNDFDLKSGAFLESLLEFIEFLLVYFDFVVNIRHETVFEQSFPW